MATLTFSYDTGSIPLSRILDGCSTTWGYQETIDGAPNPESKGAFCKRQVKRIIIEAMHNAERQQAEQAAGAAVTPIELGD